MVKTENNSFWDKFNEAINNYITFMLDFKVYKGGIAIISLILFILSLTSGGYYYIFRALKNIISIKLPTSVNPSIIFFIIKIIVFYSLLNLVLKTLLGLIFIDIEDEEHCCKMKKLVDKVSSIVTSMFFTFYMIFLIPTYLLNNVSHIYDFVINNLKTVFESTGLYTNISLASLNSSKADIKKIQKLLDKEVFEYYKILEEKDGLFSTVIKSLMKDIFVEETPELQEIKNKIRKITGNSVDFDKEEDNINITSCSYAMSINIYVLFLGIIYLLLSMLFPDSKAIVIIIFIIIILITVYFLYQSFSFKLSTRNLKFLQATIEYIESSEYKNLERKLGTISANFYSDLKKGFLPIYEIPFIGQILRLILTLTGFSGSSSNSSNLTDTVSSLTKIIEEEKSSK